MFCGLKDNYINEFIPKSICKIQINYNIIRLHYNTFTQIFNKTRNGLNQVINQEMVYNSPTKSLRTKTEG